MGMGSDIGTGVGDLWMSQQPNYSSAFDAYRQDLQQIPGIGKQYYNPYISHGLNAMNQYGQMSSTMASNPTQDIANIMSHYQASPQYKNQMAAMQTGANNAAAAGGTLGTGAEQSQVMKAAQGLSANDMQQYLNNALGVQGQGMSGLQDMSHLGYGASSSLAQMLAQNQRDLGAVDYGGRAATITGDREKMQAEAAAMQQAGKGFDDYYGGKW